MIRNLLATAAAVAVLYSGQALAEDMRGNDTGSLQLSVAQTYQIMADVGDNYLAIRPLSAEEMKNITGRVGANNVATQPWDALIDAGFTLKHNPSSDAGADNAGSLDGVAVPSAVPHSQSF